MLPPLVRYLLLPVPVLIALPGLVVARLLLWCGAEGTSLRFLAHVQAAWGRRSLRLMGVRLDLTGEPPEGPFVVTSNHLSYVDILVLASLFPGRFVAKSEIAGWPVLGWVVSLSGTLFVRRGDQRDVPRMVNAMAHTLRAGVGVTFFPEGWASRGLFVRRFHPGLLESAIEGQFPCLAVSLGFETPESDLAPAWTVGWWGHVPIWSHTWRMLHQGPIVARVRWAPEPLYGNDRKQLAEDLEVRVRAMFVPLGQERVPAPLRGDPDPSEGLEVDIPARRGAPEGDSA